MTQFKLSTHFLADDWHAIANVSVNGGSTAVEPGARGTRTVLQQAGAKKWDVSNVFGSGGMYVALFIAQHLFYSLCTSRGRGIYYVPGAEWFHCSSNLFRSTETLLTSRAVWARNLYSCTPRGSAGSVILSSTIFFAHRAGRSAPRPVARRGSRRSRTAGYGTTHGNRVRSL